MRGIELPNQNISNSEYVNPTNMDRFVLQLETTTVCNHRCNFCVNSSMDSSKKNRFMSPDFAKRILKEAYDMGVRGAALHIFGEPLTDKNILEYYRYAHELGYERLFFVTNGALATEDIISELLSLGLCSIKFSINGGNRENYRLVHGSDDYDKVMEIVRFTRAYRDKHRLTCLIGSSYVLTNVSYPYYEEHAERIRPYVDRLMAHQVSGMADSLQSKKDLDLLTCENKIVSEAINFDPMIPCQYLAWQICVSVEGFLKLCCNDPTGKSAVADLNEHNLKEAFFSKEFTDIRRQHADERVCLKVCRDCIGTEGE